MAKLLKLRRGTDTQHTTFTGAEGEVTVNTTNDSLHVHDGTTAGGRELARADLSNLPAGTIDNADINSSAAIANSKLATSGVTAGTYGSSSAIPAITVNDRGIVTSATTSAIDSTAITNGTSNVNVANNGNVSFVVAGNTNAQVDSNGLLLQDNKKIRMGGSVDLEIFHDGTNSWVKDVGTNALILDTDGPRVTITKSGASETMANFNTDGAVELYYDNAKKLATTSSGIDVTGTVNCDGLNCEGQATIVSGNGVFFLKDSNNTGTGTQCYVSGRDSANTEVWYVGQTSTGNSAIDIVNTQNADLKFGTNNVYRSYISGDGHFIPAANNAYDLGTSTNRWRNLYTNDLNLSNEGGANDVDGTWGSWTIQEGEDDLFLLNRRNGKKYKFNLSEVN